MSDDRISNDRRTFLKFSATAGAALGLGAVRGGPSELAAHSPAPAKSPPVRGRAMRILVLGGTSFIGPHQIQYALDRGHSVTLFNRGRTNTELFPEVEKLVGDRAAEGGLDALKGKTWDVVVDNSATNPKWVHDTAQLLKDQAERYIFVSTRSTYADVSRIPMSIEAPVWTYESAGVEPGAERLPYGLSKALAEAEARDAFGERATVFRPGLIIGPRDTTDRFTYWPVRIDRGGEILAPGSGSDPVQIID
ncbi:MAG: 2'-hydroxyisoflavone reductase, partial [Myxococcota bacterium]